MIERNFFPWYFKIFRQSSEEIAWPGTYSLMSYLLIWNFSNTLKDVSRKSPFKSISLQIYVGDALSWLWQMHIDEYEVENDLKRVNVINLN